MQTPLHVAVIDIGTNSARTEVAELRPDGSIVIVGDEKVSIRLGDSVFRDGTISKAAFERTVAAVDQLIAHLRAFKLKRIRAVSTSAMREADNGTELAGRIEAETGVHVEIISGPEEARLIHLGACEDFPGQDSVLVIDIGGGSTEVAVGRGRDLWLTSFRVGSARMTEYFIHTDPPKPNELRALNTFLQNAFAKRWRAVPKASICLGTAGTNGAIHDMLKREGKPFTLEHVADLYDRMGKAPLADRIKLLGPKEAQRADIIVAGLAIAKAFLSVAKVAELRYSGRGLRDGLLVEEVLRAGLRPDERGDSRSLRRAKLLQLGDYYGFDRPHCEHVAKLAGELFDQLGELHGLGEYERDLLDSAALLHDIGHHISYSKHHKHTYYLIKNSDLAGFDEREVELIANIARYHRKSEPSERHAPFRNFAKDDRRRVRMLAALLRLADACDRRHAQAIASVSATVHDAKVKLLLKTAEDVDVEAWLIKERSAALFESVFEKKISVMNG